MTLKLRNTLTSEVEEFTPQGDVVSMYVCGVTPYDMNHVGHAMSYIIFDVLRRYLEFRGYTVKHVQNFTDIEDKIILRAQAENTTIDALAENMDVLTTGGRLVSIALLQGAKGQIDLRPLLAKRLRLIGSTLRARSADEKAALTARFAEDAWPAFATGELKPVVDSVFPMRHVQQALDKLAKNENVGKVVLTW